MYRDPCPTPIPCFRSSSYMLKPNPAMQVLYLETRSLQASWALSLLEKSMHSSRAAFSSLQTQHGCSKVLSELCSVGEGSTPSTYFRLCGAGGGRARRLEVCAEVTGGCGCCERVSGRRGGYAMLRRAYRLALSSWWRSGGGVWMLGREYRPSVRNQRAAHVISQSAKPVGS